MASAAAISTLLRPPRVHASPVASASALKMHALPFLCRRPRSLTTACAAQTLDAVVQTQGAIQRWTRVTVDSIAPATEDKSIFLITLDLSGAPHLVKAYKTPGQYLLVRVPSRNKLHPESMCISSPPNPLLPKFDLLVKSVPGTTSELLCKLHVGDVVELGPITGPGFAIQNIDPPADTQTVHLIAAGVGISPIRSLIEKCFHASERADVKLFYAAKDLQSMPYQERFKMWGEKNGVKVVPLIQQLPAQEIHQPFLEHDLHEITVDPHSMGAVIVAPLLLKEVITGVLLDIGVPHDKILTIEWSPEDPFGPNV